jgi:hypothetical protein
MSTSGAAPANLIQAVDALLDRRNRKGGAFLKAAVLFRVSVGQGKWPYFVDEL